MTILVLMAVITVLWLIDSIESGGDACYDTSSDLIDEYDIYD